MATEIVVVVVVVFFRRLFLKIQNFKSSNYEYHTFCEVLIFKSFNSIFIAQNRFVNRKIVIIL